MNNNGSNTLDQHLGNASTQGNGTYPNDVNTNTSNTNNPAHSSMGLLSIVNNLEESFSIFQSKKLDELEYAIMEKDDLISQLEIQLSSLKTKIEQQEMEIHNLREEGSVARARLEELANTINKRLQQ